MAVYYSPTGNPEMWANKPDGYFTEEEWLTAHPVVEPEPEPTPTLEEARSAKLAELMRKYEAAFAPASAVYPGIEREGWFLQREEAQKVLTGGESAIIDQWVALRGADETAAEFAALVMENYEMWAGLYATLTPMQQRMYREINALTTVEAVQAYSINFNISSEEEE